MSAVLQKMYSEKKNQLAGDRSTSAPPVSRSASASSTGDHSIHGPHVPVPIPAASASSAAVAASVAVAANPAPINASAVVPPSKKKIVYNTDLSKALDNHSSSVNKSLDEHKASVESLVNSKNQNTNQIALNLLDIQGRIASLEAKVNEISDLL